MHIHGGDIYTPQGTLLEGVLDFSANINPLGLPKSVVRAAGEGAAQAAAYPDTQCRALRLALAQSEGAGLQPHNIICGNGAADLIFMLALATKPQRALLLAPGFHEYEQALRTVGCQITHHFLQEAEGFQLQPQRLQQEIEAIAPDIVFLCNPNNPTGLAQRREALQPLAELCQQRNILLVLDECFNEFLDEPEAHTLKPLLLKLPRLFILKAFTKLYAMPGLRLGYGLCSDGRLLAQMEASAQPWRVSTPAQLAGLAALQEVDYVAQAKELVRQERQFLQAGLAELGLVTYDSMANYIFFRLPQPFDLAKACRQQQPRVLIRDCSNYVGLEPGFYRVAVRTRLENELLLQALQQALVRRARP